MSEALNLRTLPSLLTDVAVLVGHGRKADVVFTPRQWFALGVHMMNENPANFFLMPYRDKNGVPKFSKAFKAEVTKRISGLGTQSSGKQNCLGQSRFIPLTQSEKRAGEGWILTRMTAISCGADLALKAFAFFYHASHTCLSV